MRRTLITLLISVSFSVSSISPVTAQTKTKIVEDLTAQTYPTDVTLTEGKATAISFENDEIITFVLLSDQSKNVYTLDAPIESGQAKSIFLRKIQTLDIPGTTTTENPNLFVVTTNSSGKQKEYEFNILNDPQKVDSYQIAIQPAKPKPKIVSEPKNYIQTDLGEAHPSDIQLGLETRLRKGLLQPDDPLIVAVKEYIALTMNGTSTQQAIKQVDVPLSILQKLGSIGLAEDTKRRLLPLNSFPKLSSPGESN